MENNVKRNIFFRVRPALPAFFILFSAVLSRAADPVVSNVRASQRPGAKLVDIYYDLSDADGGSLTVSVAVSTNSGVSYDLPAASFTGDVGSGVSAGAGRHIVWDAGADWGGQISAALRVKVIADDGDTPPLPPDPASVATEPEKGVVTLIGSSTAFLYTGSNPIQTGVVTGTISEVRAAVLRGRVTDRSGVELSGARVAVNNFAEYGYTITRTNGLYDLAVNGGQTLTLTFDKAGHLPVQRILDVPWQQYVTVEDVALIPADAAADSVSLPGAAWQSAEGSVQTDADGSRRAVVLFPPGVRAWVFDESGGTQETAALTTRFTEYTVGTNGAAAMPGDLPPTVAYTYAVELGADEARFKFDGRDALFSSNVFLYLDNFLDMPEGIGVPTASYVFETSAWTPSSDGIVLRLLGTNSAGLARICVSTNGAEADASALATLGVTDGERRALAGAYGVCTSALWRVPLDHFSTKDLNLPVTSPGSVQPNNPQPQSPTPVSSTTQNSGFGAVEMETRVFRESFRVDGTPYNLNYSSERVPGYVQGYSVNIPLSGESLPGTIQSIELSISIAGRNWRYSYAPATNLSHLFAWDGLDSYGRRPSGRQTARIEIEYVFPGFYATPPVTGASFGLAGGQAIPSLVPARIPFKTVQAFETQIGNPVNPTHMVAGWTFDAHHFYDPVNRALYLGTGERRAADALNCIIASTAAGNGSGTVHGTDSGPATNVAVFADDVAAAPDGTFYTTGGGLRRIDLDGNIHFVDGAKMLTMDAIAPAPDGAVYFSDGMPPRVYRLETNGTLTVAAGTGVAGFSGDGGPATNAALNQCKGLAVAPDGTLYIADRYNQRIRRVGPDGVIHTVAGTGTGGYSGDGGPATNAALKDPLFLAIAPDGALYFSDSQNHRIRRIGPDGVIHTVAGTGTAGYSGDGGSALNARLQIPTGVAVDSDGSLYFVDSNYHVVRNVNTEGIISTIAGSGAGGFSGDSGPATEAKLNLPGGLAIGKDKSLYVADTNNRRVRRIAPVMPGLGADTMALASADGNLIYLFDSSGRHQLTQHVLTGEVVFQFAYTNGLLASITDADGNVTSVERDAQGAPLRITGPYGHQTVLTLDANGYMASSVNAASETRQFSYTPGGLLTEVVGPRGAACRFTAQYDASGNLLQADDPNGGSAALSKTTLSNGYLAVSTSALGRAAQSRVETLPTGVLRRQRVFADGASEQTWTGTDGSVTNLASDGSKRSSRRGPHPRFGMNSPLETQVAVRLPSGLTLNRTVEFAASWQGQDFHLSAFTNRVAENGLTQTVVFSSSPSQITSVSACGRIKVSRIDHAGRETNLVTAGLAPVSKSYDAHGRISTETTGAGASARRIGYEYNAQGFLKSRITPMAQTNRFAYDAVGRMMTQTDAAGAQATYTYDAHGNKLTVTPPGRTAHAFAYNTVDMATNYTPPAVAGVPDPSTRFAYNADRQITRTSRPDGESIDYGYDPLLGGLTNISISRGNYVYAYLSNGLHASISSPDGILITNAYDGHMICSVAWSGLFTARVDYVYDAHFRCAALDLNGESVSLGYDADGLLTNAGCLALAREAASGLLAQNSLSNVAENLAYNEFAEIVSRAASANGSNLLSRTYAYDVMGRITGVTEVVQGETNLCAYAYDAAGRLALAATTHRGTNSYCYDANGNLTNAVFSGADWFASYDAQDRLCEASGITNLFSVAGDLTNRVVNGTNTSFAYDALGNLVCAVLADGTTNTYLVDGWNRRAAKLVNGVFSKGYVYSSQPGPVAELDASSNIVNRFVYGIRNSTPDYMVRSGSVYRVISDHLGSVRLVVDVSSGEVVQRMDYDEWGRVLNDTSPGFQPFGFAGGLYDADTGLVRFGARDYDPALMRWTAKDPLVFAGGLNLYAYVFGDPVNMLDSLGLGPGNTWYFGGHLTVTAPVGGTGSGGYYLHPASGEFGAYNTSGPLGGIDVGTGFVAGYNVGPPSNMNGVSVPYNLSVGPFGLSVSTSPSGQFQGASASLSFSGPAGASAGATTTSSHPTGSLSMPAWVPESLAQTLQEMHMLWFCDKISPQHVTYETPGGK